MRGVTFNSIFGERKNGFQLTRLMRGVTMNVADFVLKHFISTHTPHARRD